MKTPPISPEWTEILFRCAEKSFIVEDETKKIVWTNDPDVKPGEYCHKAFFGKDYPCEVCPSPQTDELYAWDRYNSREKQWIKIKSLVFADGNNLLRACNLNVIDDAMKLNYTSVEQISLLQKLLSENRRIKGSLEYEACHDRMTGLYNRNRFNSDISSGMFGSGRVGVLYFDLNNLKETNDRYRHEAGDRLITCLAAAIAHTANEADTPYAYRIGGDEFVLIMTDCSEEQLASAHHGLNGYLATHQTDPACICAVGEVYASSPRDAEELIAEADRAMYENKRLLKNLK